LLVGAVADAAGLGAGLLLYAAAAVLLVLLLLGAAETGVARTPPTPRGEE
jgi:hypothetical protein